jgi:LysR family glycine cleavage system transcriptional activator
MLGDRFPSLAAIRAFEAAARLGSFARAAAELGTSAASVSYHVRRLERDIGATLFARHPHRVELTEPGRIVAGETIEAFARLRASFVRAADEDERRLAITTLPSFGASWLTPKLGRFRAAWPDVRVDLDLSEAAQDVGRFDVAIRNGHGQWPGLRARRLFPSIFMPLCAPGVLEATRMLGQDSARLEAPLLGRPDWWTLWYRACGVAAGPAPDLFGTTLAYEHLDIAAAIAGQGVAIGSPILFADEIASGRLVPAHEVVASDGRGFWLAFAATHQSRAKISRFADWLGAEAEQALAAARPFIDRARIVE